MSTKLHVIFLLIIIVEISNVKSKLIISRPAGSKGVEESPDDGAKDLHIAGMFPMNGTGGWLGGRGCLPAAQMALEDVNKANLLPGYRLVLHDSDSQCNPGLGASVMFEFIYKRPIKLLMLGGCSIVCSTIAEAAKMWNLVVVGYGSSSPALSNRRRFPTFFRTHPSATIHNPTRVKLFKRYGWKRIAIILEAEELFLETGKDLEDKCKEENIEIATRVSFLTDPTDAVKSLVRQDARIIVGMFYSDAARRVMCEAYKQGVAGKPAYVWFLIGWYEDNWFEVPGVNCTKDEMTEAVEGHLTTEALMLNTGPEETVAGTNSTEWLKRYEARLHARRPEGYQEAPLAYDAIWAIAFALNKTIDELATRGLRLEDFTYENSEIKDVIIEQLKNTSFMGVSGRVQFTDVGDRIASTQFEQMIDGKYRLLGYYDVYNDKFTSINEAHWPTGKPPNDRKIVIPQLLTVSTPLYISLSTISLIGILWAISLIIFNFKFRNYRYIQMSHPSSNNIMLVGCVMCFSSVILFGLDGRYVPINAFTAMCNARAWCLSIGFSLFFGAMFAKTWHCHLLSTHSKYKKVKNSHVYLMIASFCVIDAIILTIWHLYQPMIKRIKKFEDKNPDITDDIEIEPYIELCNSNSFWYWIIYSYKGLLLLLGLFLSYETRSVKLKQLNDSRLVGMSIYNIVILCLITGPVSLVMNEQANSHFAFISLAIIFCCFLSMALIFAPKIVELVRRRGPNASGLSGSHINGTFHETMSSREEEEKYNRLNQENEDLKTKIAEKDTQIDQVKQQIEQITKSQQQKQQQVQKQKQQRKAVRIQEPDSDDQQHLNVIHMDPTSDSGFVSTRNSNRPSDFEFSESYL